MQHGLVISGHRCDRLVIDVQPFMAGFARFLARVADEQFMVFLLIPVIGDKLLILPGDWYEPLYP